MWSVLADECCGLHYTSKCSICFLFETQTRILHFSDRDQRIADVEVDNSVHGDGETVLGENL